MCPTPGSVTGETRVDHQSSVTALPNGTDPAIIAVQLLISQRSAAHLKIAELVDAWNELDAGRRMGINRISPHLAAALAKLP